ncbi:MAG: glutamate formimidoyltransferase [Bacteroidota bacterium]|jgi:glutamate formiminotransferase/formiminotetrahydrofolate cyclodeaminase
MKTYTIECIPNVSSADPDLIEDITAAIMGFKDVDLRFVDPGHSVNRTVFTYLGPVESVLSATAELIRIALAYINMEHQKGIHPRMGAVDVCPFVLLDDSINEEHLIERVREFSAEIGERFALPIYNYEQSATRKERENLADVRRGQYEGLAARFERGDLPDHGPQEWNEAAREHGATAMGVRSLMVAYNINLTGRPNKELKPIAEKMAVALREKNSGLPGVKAIAWYLPEFDIVQVSCNLTKPFEAGVCEVFDYARSLAKSFGCDAPSSELIGCIPRSQFTTYTEEELGFGQFKPFNESRILPL